MDMSDGDLSMIISENGNDFLGIEGLEEGKDYTYDKTSGKLVLKSETLCTKASASGCGPYAYYYLNFKNGIRKTVTALSIPLPDIDYFVLSVGEGIAKQGDSIKVPLTIGQCMKNCYLSGSIITLQYDKDIFEDAYIEPQVFPYGIADSVCDKNKGTVTINYIRDGRDLSPEVLDTGDISMNLVLKVKEDSLIGDTKIAVAQNKFTADSDEEVPTNTMSNYDNGLITITK